ncbi:hypothetical protein PV326_000653, partial [Microctonus aethiopoides]
HTFKMMIVQLAWSFIFQSSNLTPRVVKENRVQVLHRDRKRLVIRDRTTRRTRRSSLTILYTVYDPLTSIRYYTIEYVYVAVVGVPEIIVIVLVDVFDQRSRKAGER